MPRKLPKIIAQDEIAALLDQPSLKSATGIRNRTILELLVNAGLRVAELCNLKPGHIRWQTGEVEVVNGKGGADRVIPVHKETMDWLRRWEEKRPNHSRFFFTTIKGKAGSKLAVRFIGEMVGRYATAAGIQDSELRESGRRAWKVHPHTLRHTFASHLLDIGYSLAEVQALLGHVNIQTTSIYLHVNPTALREKIQSEPTRQERDLTPTRWRPRPIKCWLLWPKGAVYRMSR